MKNDKARVLARIVIEVTFDEALQHDKGRAGPEAEAQVIQRADEVVGQIDQQIEFLVYSGAEEYEDFDSYLDRAANDGVELRRPLFHPDDWGLLREARMCLAVPRLEVVHGDEPEPRFAKVIPFPSR